MELTSIVLTRPTSTDVGTMLKTSADRKKVMPLQRRGEKRRSAVLLMCYTVWTL